MKTQWQITIVLILLGGLVLIGVVLAAPVATTLERYVIGGGGGHTEAGIFSLDGTIGQAVVGKLLSACIWLMLCNVAATYLGLSANRVMSYSLRMTNQPKY